MDGGYRLRVRIGDSEFEAEGPEGVVKQQFQDFLALVGRPRGGGQDHGDAEESTEGKVAPPPVRALDEILAKDKDGCVYLRYSPSTDTVEHDALVLLLLGFRELNEESAVLGTRLLKAAQRSHIHIRRVNEVLRGSAYIKSGGVRKGVRYSLNNIGLGYARKLLEDMR
jgi:hypothetical protein